MTTMTTMTKHPRLLLVATLLSVALAVGINVVDAPGTMVWFKQRTGVGTLDAMPLAGATAVHDVLRAMGDDGRALYLREIVVFDLLFPVALLAMVHLAIVQVWRAERARTLVTLPWAALAIDLVENGVAFQLTRTFPRESPAMANVVGVLTALKFAAYGAGLVAVAVGVIARRRRPLPPAAQHGS
jgi:hypothetical protein